MVGAFFYFYQVCQYFRHYLERGAILKKRIAFVAFQFRALLDNGDPLVGFAFGHSPAFNYQFFIPKNIFRIYAVDYGTARPAQVIKTRNGSWVVQFSSGPVITA